MTLLDHDDDELTNALAYARCKYISDFVAMPHDILDALVYPSKDEATGKTILYPVPNFYKAHVKIFQGYVAYRKDLKDPINNKWLDITEEQLNAYKVSNYHQVYIKSGIPKEMKPTIHQVM